MVLIIIATKLSILLLPLCTGEGNITIELQLVNFPPKVAAPYEVEEPRKIRAIVIISCKEPGAEFWKEELKYSTDVSKVG